MTISMATAAKDSARPAPASHEEASKGRLDLNLLNVFDVVMTERHVTRAADRLGMTQSAVSNALNRLRRRFQDQLFIKAPRGVEPTPKALSLYPRVHQAIADLYGVVEPAVFDAESARQRFRIAMVDITASLIAPHLYKTVHTHSPGTNLFFVPHAPAETGPRLMRGELDFAFVIEPPRASVIQSMPLWSDKFVLAARRGHPLLDGRLSLADFCSAPQVMINEPGDEEAPNPIDSALASKDLERNVCLTVNQFSVVPSILCSSDLISALPARFAMASQYRDLIGIRPLPFTISEAVVYLCWHQRSNSVPANQWLKQRLLEAATAVNLETEGFLSDALRSR